MNTQPEMKLIESSSALSHEPEDRYSIFIISEVIWEELTLVAHGSADVILQQREDSFLDSAPQKGYPR